MKLIMKYLLRYKILFFANIVAVILIALAELGIPLLIGQLVDDVLPLASIDAVYQLIISFIIIAVVGILGNLLINFASAKSAAHILRDLRNDLFIKFQEFSSYEVQQISVSSMMTRTTSDVYQILNFVTSFYRSAVMAPIMFIISAILVVRTAPKLSAGILLILPLIIIVIMVIFLISKKLSNRQQKNLDLINHTTRENLTGVRVVRAFRKNAYEAKRFNQANIAYTDTSTKLFRLMTSVEPVFFFLLNISVVITLYLGSGYIDKGEVTNGQLIAFNDFQFHIMFSILVFSMLFMLLPRAIVSARRISEILEKEPMIKNHEKAINQLEPIENIVFDRVSFKYPDGENYVLKDISFTVRKGQTIAFIGSTGSGKSTLIQLIPRLYEQSEGKIQINGIDHRMIDLSLLRNRIGYMLQKPLLFKGTILDNIKYGYEKASFEEVQKAAQIAQAEDFILKKEKQYEDEVSELGSNLSGGQKQRLSIARAIVKNPDIYVFDDSFSALDYETDANLRKALYHHASDKIICIVAQRVSSIVSADIIVVLDEGKIVDMGKHDTLLKTSKIYQEIALSQTMKESD